MEKNPFKMKKIQKAKTKQENYEKEIKTTNINRNK